jgi:hypothetical protein
MADIRHPPTEQRREPGEVPRPAVAAVDAVAHALPSRTVPLQVTVVQLDPRPAAVERKKPHLDFTRLVEVGDDLPSRADVPAEDQPVRRLEGANLGPQALGPVRSPVDDVPADPRLEHRLGDRCPEHVVLPRLKLADPFGERCEGLRREYRNHDVVANCGVGHHDSSLSRSSSKAA